MGRINHTYRAFAALAGVLLVTACTVHKQDAPSLTGPSELGTAIVLTVSPDVLTQDGSSQSLVQITARNNNGQPLANVSLRAGISVDGAITDFGRLSAKNVVTDGSGRASLTYTAPTAVLGITSTVNVDILVTPGESDFGNSTTRYVTIHLVPPGVVGAPTSPFVPQFNAPSATVGNPAVFVASSTGTSSSAQVATYVWDFGDGQTSVGSTVPHTYARAGTFIVTLGLIDTLGRVNSVQNSVSVGQGTLPSPSFSYSPKPPGAGDIVNFNASGSTAEAGHSITSYAWDFGDGTTKTGELTTHDFVTAGSFTVTLTVTDDVGRKAQTTQSVAVGAADSGTAIFFYSPNSPGTTGTVFTFDASQSRPGGSASINHYEWTFEGLWDPVAQTCLQDNVVYTAVAPTTTHQYATTGTRCATLTVVQSGGQRVTAFRPITIQ